MATKSGKTGLFAFDPARCDALSEVLAERWWAVGLRGILAIIFGLICLLTPGIAVGAFVIVFAAYMFVDGVFAIISGIRAARSGENWGLLILEGVVDLAAGAIAVLWPAITLVVLVWIVAIWAIVSGALMLAAAFSLNLDYGRWWLALGGIASTVFGILLIIEPLIGCGADIVDRRLCHRVWRALACAGLPAPFKARSAIAESTGRREESLSPDKPCLLASLCSAQKDNLKHADRALARLTAGEVPSVSIWSAE